MKPETSDILLVCESHHASAQTDIDTLLLAITKQLGSADVSYETAIL